MINPVILFIPVSSLKGIGEYSRSLIIAKAINTNILGAEIHFVLNRHAKYSQDCPFPVHYSDHSATKDTPAVLLAIKKLKPDLVIFDCAGRARQYAAAKMSGAKVIFISQHRRKRARGITVRRQINIDLHWVVQPEFAIRALTSLEKFKLRLMGKPSPTNIGPILPNYIESEAMELLRRLKLLDDQYFIFSAGSGGHDVDGALVADLFHKAAITFQEGTKTKCLVIFGENYPSKVPTNSPVICLKSLASSDFIALLKHANGRVLSAGDTLLQAISLKKPSVGVPVSKDQPIRLEKCVAKGLAIAADTSINDILKNAKLLLNPTIRNDLLHKLEREKSELGLSVAINDIKSLLDGHRSHIHNSKDVKVQPRVTKRQKKYIFFASQDYSFPVLRPLQKEILSRGDKVFWFLYGPDINKANLRPNENTLFDIHSAIRLMPDAVFVPGNVVPSFIPGLKVQVFHGLPSTKIKKNGQLYHYIIRGMFDLYCTQGPNSTSKFKSLKEQYGFFSVVETGWCKLDPLFELNVEATIPSQKTIFFASTFSPRFSRAKILYPIVVKMMKQYDFNWYVTLHPKMEIEVVNLYRSIDLPNVHFVDSTNLLKAFQHSDLMLCDTSSIIYEFLALRKPVVTFQTETEEPYLVNVKEITLLEKTVLNVLRNLRENEPEIKKSISCFHPYNDGKSSKRILDSVEDMLLGDNIPKKQKPKNIVRNLKLRLELNYWNF